MYTVRPKLISLRISEDNLNYLKKYAVTKNKSLNRVINDIIRAWIINDKCE